MNLSTKVYSSFDGRIIVQHIFSQFHYQIDPFLQIGYFFPIFIISLPIFFKFKSVLCLILKIQKSIKKAKAFITEINSSILRNNNLDGVVKNQLRRASLSIVLNIAEGSSRFSKPDRKNYSVIARGSVFECAAIFDILKDTQLIKTNQFNELYLQAEEISKILFEMIKNLEK